MDQASRHAAKRTCRVPTHAVCLVPLTLTLHVAHMHHAHAACGISLSETYSDAKPSGGCFSNSKLVPGLLAAGCWWSTATGHPLTWASRCQRLRQQRSTSSTRASSADRCALLLTEVRGWDGGSGAWELRGRGGRWHQQRGLDQPTSVTRQYVQLLGSVSGQQAKEAWRCQRSLPLSGALAHPWNHL